MIRFEGRVTPGQRRRSPYVYLPFDVPAGAERVSVRYGLEDGSILDLGLLDPTAGPFPSLTGFRGWSGSARREVHVAAADATPGYMAGPLQAGRWQVVLGLARVAAAGCAYRVEVDVGRGDAPAAGTAEAAAAAPAAGRRAPGATGRVGAVRAGAGWYRGDLQSHTFHSDARASVAELAAEARARGLDFLAVTDHNTVSHHAELPLNSASDLLLVPGEEVTTYRGHANVWGVAGWVDFRIERPGDLDALVAQVHARGGLFSVNHPKTQPGCIGCDWEYPVPGGADAMEAWQGPWALGNWESLARYDALLREGRRLTLVGGSDRHHPGASRVDPPLLQVGSPTTWLELEELSTPAVLTAIRAGRAYVSEGPGGPRLELSVGGAGMGGTVGAGAPVVARARVEGATGDVLRWVGTAGVVRETALGSDDVTDAFEWVPAGAFLRCEVVARASLPALEAELRTLAAGPRFPSYLSVADVLAHPWRRLVSNPVYVG